MSEAKENVFFPADSEQFYQAVRNGVYDAVMTIMEPQDPKRDRDGFLPADSRPLDESRQDILRAIKHGVFDSVAFSDIEKLIASSEEERGQAQIDQMITDFKRSHGLPLDAGE